MDPPTEEECRQFLENPKVNPRTGKGLYKTGQFYKMLVAICAKKSPERKKTTPRKIDYSKKELNAMARTIITGYTKMSVKDLFIELEKKLKSMNITIEQRYRQVFGRAGEKKGTPTSPKEPPMRVDMPAKSVQRKKSTTEILKDKHKIKLTLSRMENNPDDIKVKVNTDIAKTKAHVRAKNIKKILDQFFADMVDKQELLKQTMQTNVVVLYSITNQGIRFHIPTLMDEINYDGMMYKNLPFEPTPSTLTELDEKINNQYISYHRLTEQEMNTVSEYDIFDMNYVKNIPEDIPLKKILNKIYREISNAIRSV